MNSNIKIDAKNRRSMALYLATTYARLIEYADVMSKCEWSADIYFDGLHETIKSYELTNGLVEAAADIASTEMSLYKTMYETWQHISKQETIYIQFVYKDLCHLEKEICEPALDVDILLLFNKFFTILQESTFRYSLQVLDVTQIERAAAFNSIRQAVDGDRNPPVNKSDTDLDKSVDGRLASNVVAIGKRKL